MKVLYVNWVDYLDAERRGGGVSLYQRNLMAAEAGNEAVFLASGTSYDIRKRPPRWEKIRHGPREDRKRRFEIVNSGVMAPGHVSFGEDSQLAHAATEAAFFDFLGENGPFDIVHFNNLEGLPAEALGLKKHFPDTRVIFSLHNYYPLCPQVNLWKQERVHCTDFKDGSACETCLITRPSPRSVRLAAGLAYNLKCAGIEPGSVAYAWSFRIIAGLGRRMLRLMRRVNKPSADNSAPGENFRSRRIAMVRALNEGCDTILCVSKAVREIAVSYGVKPELTQTCYIGTRQADAWAQNTRREFPLRSDGTIALAYLGYMRRDKGFFFLLDALEQAPEQLLAKLRFVVAARRGDPNTQARLEALSPRLAELVWYDGYGHDQLDQILEGVDVGLVPPLWADNLPQVAIEMHSRHIPILCSNQGGAKELAEFEPMVFRAGDITAFQSCLHALVGGEIDLDDYWQSARPPTTMNEHLADLEQIYMGRRLT